MSAWEGSKMQEAWENMTPEQRQTKTDVEELFREAHYLAKAECANCGCRQTARVPRRTLLANHPCSNCGINGGMGLKLIPGAA